MALGDKIAKEMSRALREVAKTFNFKDKNFIKIIRKATNLYQMLQEINYSGRLDNAESLIASRVFVHIDAIAELADEQKAGDEVEALLAAFKCLMNSMKARGVATGSLFIDNKKADIDWDILEGDDCEEAIAERRVDFADSIDIPGEEIVIGQSLEQSLEQNVNTTEPEEQ